MFIIWFESFIHSTVAKPQAGMIQVMFFRELNIMNLILSTFESLNHTSYVFFLKTIIPFYTNLLWWPMNSMTVSFYTIFLVETSFHLMTVLGLYNRTPWSLTKCNWTNDGFWRQTKINPFKFQSFFSPVECFFSRCTIFHPCFLYHHSYYWWFRNPARKPLGM